ncbi:MAG: 30S ribosomal protein S6 [Candidatus Moranbacteria bacterium]|nr:30S ribosomal protein S6 [Candidatus Moranbacteria bacterium]
MAAKETREYELFYLVGDSKEAELPTIRAEVEKIVTDFGGTFLAEETEEKRNLAYEILDERRGTYIARRFTLPEVGDEPFSSDSPVKENVIESIDRLLRLYQPVSRFILMRAEKLPELKAIPREERVKPVRRDDRRSSGGGRRFPDRGGERRSAEPARAEKPVMKDEAKSVEDEKKPIAQEDLDKQLKEVLDI